jgi:hypothetical protein
MDVLEKNGSSRLPEIKPHSFEPQPFKIMNCPGSISSVNTRDNMQNFH